MIYLYANKLHINISNSIKPMKNAFGIVAIIIFLSGCGQNDTRKESTNLADPGSEEAITIVASFYPLAYIAQRIGGEKVSVTNLVGSSDPHDYSLSPRDIVQMQEANVVFLHGAGLEPWGEEIEMQLKTEGTPVVTVTQGMTLAPAKENDHKDQYGDEETDEHADEREHHDDETSQEEDEHEAENSEHAHEHGEFDPHVWLDPIYAQKMIDIIAATMIEVDAANTAEYQSNAQTVKTEFQSLHEQYVEGLAQCERRKLIVSHDAFGYLAERYNFTAHSIVGLSTQDEPSAQTLAQLKNEAKEGMTHILTEQNTAGRFANTLSSETGLELLPINTLASSTEDGKDFVDRARGNLVAIQTALGCAL